MRAFLILDRVIVLLGRAGLVVAGACLVAIMAIGSLDAILTNAIRRPVPSALELSEVLLAVAVFLSLASTQRRDQHVRVDILIERAPRWLQRLSALLGLAIALVVFGLIAWQAFNLARASLAIGETASAIIPFPVYPAKLLVFAGAVLVALECLRRILSMLLRRPDAAP